MEHTAFESQKYYSDCKKIIQPISYALVELHVVPSKNQIKVSIVITHAQPNGGTAIGINDCAKVHRLLLPFFEQALPSADLHMEVTSPGMERTLKNAAEFELFIGRKVKVWHTAISDWISGNIVSTDEKSVCLKIIGTNEEKSFSYDTIAKAKLLGDG